MTKYQTHKMNSTMSKATRSQTQTINLGNKMSSTMNKATRSQTQTINVGNKMRRKILNIDTHTLHTMNSQMTMDAT